MPIFYIKHTRNTQIQTFKQTPRETCLTCALCTRGKCVMVLMSKLYNALEILLQAMQLT